MPRRYPEARKWYRTAEWKRLREVTLLKSPVCTRCQVKQSTVADHKTPHRGNRDLFFDESNLTGCCKLCHDSWKQKKENGRVDTECTEDGYPVDKNHPWNN